MFLLAHVGAALLTGRLLQAADPRAAGRLRWWAVGGFLPDLVDKPLAALVPAYAGYGRGAGHTLLFVLLLVAVSVRLNACRGVGLGAATHLLLDAPWTYPATFAWPLLGFVPPAGATVGVEGYLQILSANVHVWAGELVGAAVLTAMGLEAFARRVVAPAVAVKPGRDLFEEDVPAAAPAD